MDFSEIDKNFKVPTAIEKEDPVFFDAESAPFQICGVERENGVFRRMPLGVAEAASQRVRRLNRHTAGGRIRFRTNSTYVAVKPELLAVTKLSHFSLTGSISCDVYTRESGNPIYRGTVVPPFAVTDTYEGVVELRSDGMKEVTVNLPLYSEVAKVYIGLQAGCSLLPPEPYTYEKPVVFYGSSITQGGCASRPGCTYEAMLSRALDFDYVNLGFSGSAKGETVIAEYISKLEMSAFVFDYDHNSSSPEHYLATHEPFFRIIRQAHPTLPVLFLTRPKKHLLPGEEKRLRIAEDTYRNALAAGDGNVRFIPGTELISDEAAEIALVDNIHPNDAGFLSMAQAIRPVLGEMLKNNME